jgi:Tol biopolymer transport system component
MVRRRLTANPEDAPVTSAAISPDGKYLAYTDSTGFYLRLVETGETHPVSLPREFDPSVESWFPDSVHLVISWIEDSGRPPSLWVISVLGGTPRKLTDVGSFARVSPDGAQIAFMRGSWDDNEIWLADPNGNGVRKIVDGGLDYFGPAAWSPDGKEFAFVRASVERPEGRIQIYDVGKGRVETVLSLAGLGSDICWVRSGELVYSLSEAPPNQDNSNLWSVQLDTRTGRPAGAAIRISDDHDRVGSITATSDGKLLAVLRFTSQQDVYLASIEDKGKRISPPRRFTLDQRQDFPSSWTPDSKAVLIVSNRDGVSHIFRQKIDETQPELFVGGKQDVWLPHMTPDGLDMLYLASPEQVGPSDNVRLMSIPLAGGPSRLILEEPGIVSYQCARLPSQACVYGQVEAELFKFYLFDPSRGNRSELPIKMKKGSAMNNWNLSPDGRYLAISETQNPYEGPRLRLISLIDQTEKQLSTSQPRLIIGVDWAADARSLWLGGFMSRGSWGVRSGLVNVDLRGHVTPAIEGRSPVILGGTPSPDGHTLALGANTFSSNVWLLETP